MEIDKYYYVKSNYPFKEVTTSNVYVYILKVLYISNEGMKVDILVDNSITDKSIRRELGIIGFPTLDWFIGYNWTIEELDEKTVKTLYEK